MPKPPVYKSIPRSALSDLPDEDWANAIVDGVNESLESQVEFFQGNISFKENLNCEILDFDVYIPDPFYNVTGAGTAQLQFQNGWSNKGVVCPLRVMKHPDSSVEIQGLVADGTLNTVITLLPDEFKPRYDLMFPSIQRNAGATAWIAGTIKVGADGLVSQVDGVSASQVAVNVRFLPLDTTPRPSKAWPVTLKTRFTDPPLGVFVIDCANLDRSQLKPYSSPSGIDWDFQRRGNDGVIRIKNIPHLAYSRRQNLTLLVIGG